MIKTFNEWSKAGYKINKGSKGQKVGNNWYFTDKQVTYSPRRSSFTNINQGDHKGFENTHYDYRYGDFDNDCWGDFDPYESIF